jgi:hypothetical protein
MTKTAALCLLFAFAAIGPAAGQDQKLDIMPVVGLYAPTNDLAVLLPAQGGTQQTVTFRHKAGLLLGARLVAWWTRTIGWEGSFGYALSEGRRELDGSSTCGTEPASCKANVWIASSKLLGRWRPQADGTWFLFGGAGLSVVGHTGDFWSDSDAVTDLAGVLNAGAVFDLARLIDLRFEVEDHIYQFKPRIEGSSGMPLTLGARWQHDLVVSASVAFRILGTDR